MTKLKNLRRFMLFSSVRISDIKFSLVQGYKSKVLVKIEIAYK